MQALTHKKLWLRVNRTLAWVLIISPAVQIAMGSDWLLGLLWDLAVLLVHGGLSVWLFGRPQSLGHDDGAMHWLGTSEARMTPRSRFLLSGWRVLISTSYFLALPLVGYCASVLSSLSFVSALVIPGVVAVVVLIAAVNYFGLMWPYAAVTHVFGASTYALRRWGTVGSSNSAIAVVSSLIALMFMVLSVANLTRPLWSPV
jgi:hypothetical protein